MEKELRAFIACGDSRQGFAVARCEACQKRLLVPLSCKRRGICGSCIARRMCDAAAHLVDHVFPGNVPVRQWVISAPFELRLLLARDATAYGAVTRIFAEEVLGWYARRAVERGIVEHPRDARGAAVTAQQRWGSSLNLHPHIHAAFVDGVFTRAVPAQTEAQTQTETETQTQTASNATVSERAVFHTLLAPTSADLESIVLRIHARVLRWLRHRGFISDEQPFSNDRAEPAALDVFSQAALGVGRLQHVEPHEIAEMPAACSDCDADVLDARFLPKSSGSRRAGANGWSLHAGTTVARGDRDALERLLRYFTRPPLAQARLFVLRDGRIAYEVRKPWRRDQTHRIMTPLELMARLAAVIPAPRAPLVRFHGCFAPNCSWRRAVVPVATGRNGFPKCNRQHVDAGATTIEKTGATASGDAASVPKATAQDVTPRSASPWRLDWATLLYRVHNIDALACDCGGRLHFVDLITDPAEAQRILGELGRHSEPPPVPHARARDPTGAGTEASPFDTLPPSDWD